MSIQVRGSASGGSNIAEVGGDGLLRVVNYGPDLGSGGGRFVHSCKTGATVAIAALDGTNGIHWAFRYTSTTSTRVALVERVLAKYTTTVGPSAAQQHGISLYRATSFSAIPTAGTAATLTTPNAKLSSASDVPEALISFENTTSEMTAGTHTLDALPLMERTEWMLAAGAAVQMKDAELDFDARHSPLVLKVNEGLLLGPAVTQANSLAQVLRVTVWWRECESYGQ